MMPSFIVNICWTVPCVNNLDLEIFFNINADVAKLVHFSCLYKHELYILLRNLKGLCSFYSKNMTLKSAKLGLIFSMLRFVTIFIV